MAIEERGKPSMESFMIHGRHHTQSWDYNHHLVPPLGSSTTYRLERSDRGAMGFTTFTDPQSHTYEQPHIYIYDRLDEPTRAMLEDRIAVMEGGDTAVCYASGMAAISAIIGVLCHNGQNLVSHKAVYGCTYSLFANWMPRFGIQTRFVNMLDIDDVAKNIDANTRVLYFETPVNPTMEIIDIRMIVDLAREINAKRPEQERVQVVVDNTFATTYCQRPLEHGADVVVHSLTKNMCGFGTDMGGVVIAPTRLKTELMLFRKDFGGALSSKNAWGIMVYGLPTLGMRVRLEMRNTMQIAKFLDEHPMVATVNYPGLSSHPQYETARKQMSDFKGNFTPGTLLAFTLKGTIEESDQLGTRLVDLLADEGYTMTLAVSLGNIKTLIEKPNTMTHAAIPPEAQRDGHLEPGLIRISVGAEEPEDLIKDLDHALKVLAA